MLALCTGDSAVPARSQATPDATSQFKTPPKGHGHAKPQRHQDPRKLAGGICWRKPSKSSLPLVRAKSRRRGYPDAAALFRSVAEGKTGHAHGHLEYIAEVGDPASGEPIGETEANFKASIAGETYEYTQMYPGFAKTARDEGFDEIADWFETLARAEKSHAGRFGEGLAAL